VAPIVVGCTDSCTVAVAVIVVVAMMVDRDKDCFVLNVAMLER